MQTSRNRKGVFDMIEEYWQDIVVYSVEFIVKSGNKESRNISKMLAFNSMLSEKEILSQIKSKFNNVIDVCSIDEFTDVLLLKDSMII